MSMVPHSNYELITTYSSKASGSSLFLCKVQSVVTINAKNTKHIKFGNHKVTYSTVTVLLS